MKNKKLTIKDIRELNPCYDPTRYVAENWEGKVQDILRMSYVDPQDRMWVCCNETFVDKDLLFKFAIVASRQCHYVFQDDLEQALSFLNHLEIIQLSRELNNDSLRDYVWDYSWDHARDHAWASARASVRASAWDSVRASARTSARDSVRDSVRASARASAWDYARASAWDELCLILADMIDGVEIDSSDTSIQERLCKAEKVLDKGE